MLQTPPAPDPAQPPNATGLPMAPPVPIYQAPAWARVPGLAYRASGPRGEDALDRRWTWYLGRTLTLILPLWCFLHCTIALRQLRGMHPDVPGRRGALVWLWFFLVLSGALTTLRLAAIGR